MVKKYRRKLGAIFLGLLILAFVAEQKELGLESGNKIRRNQTGKGSQELSLNIEAGTEISDYPYTFFVEEKKLTDDQKKTYIEAAKEEIDSTFYSEGDSAKQVRNSVNLCKTYQKNMVSAEWYFDDYDIIDLDGKLQQEKIPEEGKMVQAFVELECYGYCVEYHFTFQVFPQKLNLKEKILQKISKKIEEELKRENENYLYLPNEIDGIEITWSKKKEYLVLKVLLLEVITLIAILLEKKEKEKRKMEKRAQQLKLAYPEMIGKITVLLSAGMSIRHAWNIISTQYLKRKEKEGKIENPVYEEMLETNREMEDGKSERVAYQHFSERIGMQMYRRFIRLVIQNMNKGSQSLGELLIQETERAYTERSNYARKLGEEAGTKMLFPMMILLSIVMAIVLVPALLSFG